MVVEVPDDCPEFLASKSKIDRAGQQLVDNPLDHESYRAVQCYRIFRARSIPTAVECLLPAIEDSSIRVAARLKRVPSIIRKLQRFRQSNLARMADIIGLRIVCNSAAVASEVSNTLRKSPLRRNERDYISSPPKTGYRAVHIYLGDTQVLPETDRQLTFDIEVQVRSYYQHIWALQSESRGEQVKEGGGPSNIRHYLSELSRVIAQREADCPEEIQTDFESLDTSQHIAVVLSDRKGSNSFTDLRFDNYSDAIRQLLYWEERQNSAEALLLVGVGNTKTIHLTHSVFLGGDVPLFAWMPRPP